MNKKFKQLLVYLVALVIIFLIVIPLTACLSPNLKAVIHSMITLVFFGLVFNMFSSFRQPTSRKLWLTIAIIVGMIFVLPIAINLLATWPIVIKGIMHFTLIALILSAIIYVWHDPAKN